MTDRCAEILTKLDALQASVDEIDEDVGSIDTSITTINDNITNINTNIVDVQNSLTIVQNNLTIVQNNLSIVNNKVINISIQNTINVDLSANLPDVTYSTDTADTTQTLVYVRYNALCQAMFDWLYCCLYSCIYFLGGDPAQLNNVFALINVYAQSATDAAIGILNGAPATTLVDLYNASQDPFAIDDVVCAMLTNLTDKKVSQGTFASAIAAYTPPPYPDNRYTLWVAITFALAKLNIFNLFGEIYKGAYQKALAANPTGYVCSACAPPTVCTPPHTWDFTQLQKNPWIITRGILTEGQGLVGQQTPYDTGNYGYDVSWFPDPTCAAALPGKGLKFTANHLNTGVGNAWTLEFWSINTSTLAIVKFNTSSFGPTATYPAVTQSARANIPAAPAGTTLYRIRWYTNTAYYGNATNQPSLSSLCPAIDLTV